MCHFIKIGMYYYPQRRIRIHVYTFQAFVVQYCQVSQHKCMILENFQGKTVLLSHRLRLQFRSDTHHHTRCERSWANWFPGRYAAGNEQLPNKSLVTTAWLLDVSGRHWSGEKTGQTNRQLLTRFFCLPKGKIPGTKLTKSNIHDWWSRVRRIISYKWPKPRETTSLHDDAYTFCLKSPRLQVST